MTPPGTGRHEDCVKLDTKFAVGLEWHACVRDFRSRDGGGIGMYVNVSKLTLEPSGSRRTFEIDEECSLLEESEPRHVWGSATMLRTDEGIWVSARLDAEVTIACGRCLASYVQFLQMVIEEEFLLEVDRYTGTRVSRPQDGDQYFYIGPDRILDLTEAARQYAALSMPMKPVCRDDCAGMCLECGANLNEAPCRCQRAPVDTRWAALSALVSAGDEDR